MIKVLLKKQMMEMFSSLFYNTRTGKPRSAGSALGFAALYVYVIGFFGYFFYQMAEQMAPLLATPVAWLYTSMMALTALTVGVFISGLVGYNALYQAKDNDMLLSMPIPTLAILTARMLAIYLVGLFCELLAMVPAIIVYFQYAEWNLVGAISMILTPFVLSLFVLTLACALGYLIALIASRLKHKNVVTIVMALLFLAGYFYVYTSMVYSLGDILTSVNKLEGALKWVYPIYQLSLGTQGDAVAMLIGSSIFVALFAVTLFVLAQNFIKLVTSNRGNTRVEYREKRVKRTGADGALLRKEFYRLIKNPAYFLNCALGSVFMLVAAVLLPIKGNDILQMVQSYFSASADTLLIIVVALVCGMASMTDLTAPSISLEGKNLWICQALPVSGFQVLMAKLKLHLYFGCIPALAMCVAILFVLMPAWYYWIVVPVLIILYVAITAMLGLLFNLKFPNFGWQNETAAVKNSMSVVFSMLLNMVIAVAIALLFFAVKAWFTPVMYMIVVAAIFLVASVVLFIWLKKRGSKIFEEF